jgi:hypothetical protein
LILLLDFNTPPSVSIALQQNQGRGEIRDTWSKRGMVAEG